MADEHEKLVEEMRPIATKFAQQIAAIGNAHPNPGQAAGLLASLTFQNIVVTITWQVFGGGRTEGEAFIRSLYEQALKDAVERWHKADLKQMGPG